MQSDISPAEFDAIRHDSAIPSSPGVTGGDKEREKSLQSYQRADKSEVAIAACSSVCDTSVVSCGEAELIIISESDEEQLNSEVPDATNSEAASDVISKSKNNIERLQNDLLTKLNPETTQRDTVNSPKSLSDFHSNERVTDYCLSERAYLNNRLKIAFWNSEPDITNKDSFNNVIASEPVISVKDFRGGKSVTGSSCSSNPASFEVPSDKNIQYSTPNYKSESDQHIKTDKVERKLSDEQRRTANIVEKNLINKSNFEKNTRPVDYFISISSPDLKRFDDNNNKVLSIGNRTIERTGKKDGYAEFVRKLSVDRYVDDDIDYSLDLGRAAASQLLSSDSEESVDDDLISNFRKEVFSLSNPNVVTLPSVSSRESVTVTKETQQESRNSRVQQSPLSGDIKFSTSPFTHDIKTAPIIETPAEKKRLGGIRRLLSPNLFSNDSRRKTNIDQGCGKHPDHADTKSKTLLETAFVGDVSKKQRSKSVSPNRSVNDDRSQVKYGIPKRKSDEVRQCCHDNSVKCSSVVGNRPELGFLQVDTENKRDSVASSTSSTSTLVSPEEKNSQWIKDTIKTQSLPQHYQSVKSRIPLNQSGRLSAPPYINYYNSPYGHIKHDTLLMPVSAQMKITSPPQYHNIKAKQLQNYDFLYRNQSSSVESSPGSQNSPQSYEIRNFDHAIGPNVSLVKPQPVYNRGVHSRPRSVSPATGRMGSFVTPENYFVRGSNQRHTISGGARQRQSTIYEEVQDDKEIKLNEMKYKKNSSVDLNTSVGSKRVSFSPNYEHDINSENVYWPTRKGLAPEPPTRQSAKPENDSYIHQTDADYVNISEMKMKSVTEEAPNRPLPPVPKRTVLKQNSVGYGVIGRNVSRSLNQALSDSAVLRQVNQPTTPRVQALSNRWQQQSDTESGSEAGEIQRILQDDDGYRFQAEEEWAGGEGKSGRSTGNAEQSAGTTPTRDEDNRRGRGRRDDPRRHTLSGDHHHNYPSALARSMDLEMGSKSQRRKSPLPRGYPPPSTAMLFDEDPGIMSEVETSSTGFRRGGKQRSSLPVVRTPSKTLERPLGSRRGDDSSLTSENHNSTLQADDTIVYNNIPLHCGLVFLQYRSETKRALLPNEITSIDTVKALFVRSFPKQLTMEYLDSPMVKIYIHDSSKDMFYELEDLRSHLRDIRDRSVLRLFESADVSGSGMPGGLVPPPTWDQDQSYFSEPEFDSEYQHQHIHKTKGSKSGHQPYYMTHSFPPGGAPATLPRSGPLLRAFSPALPGASKPPSDRIHADAGYMSSPERGGGAPPRSYPPSYAASTTPYEDPYYSQYSSRTGSITPVIDEEASDTELIDESYSLYGVKLPVPRGQFPAPAIPSYDSTRIRVEHMERQLANLTGLVQKALTQAPTPTPREFLQVPPGSTSNYPSDDYDKHSSSSSASLPDESYHRPDSKPPKLGRDKSVSFEKSVSFSDEPPDMNSPKQHSPQHGVDTKPTKPAIKSSTLPRTSSQERDRHKPAPPPKPVSLSPGQYEGRHVYRDLQLTPEMYNQLRGLQKKAKDLRQEVRNLRRMSQAQAHTVRETIRDTFIKIRAMIMTGGEGIWSAGNDTERTRLNREEDLYKQEMIRLESDLTELESTVEELRGNVINRKTRVNMSDVENMALVLSKSSKTVADLKLRFPSLQEAIRSLLNQEMEKVVCEEKFLKEEPERLESALRRCKKLTGTLVTLKRLASVQEQRLPEARISPTLDETPPVTPTSGKATGTGDVMGQSGSGGSTTSGRSDTSRPENALDALLDELQTFAKPPVLTGSSTLRRLHSYPSGEGGKPPVPERGADLLNKRVPPPPPPRTSSRSPLSSPTGPSVPPRGSPLKRNTPGRSSLKENTKDNPTLASNSSSCESVNSQEGMQHQHQQSRQELLEQRHQELLRKQRALQEQYTRLQQLQRAPPPDLLQLKKTGSESNLLAKMGLGLSAAVPISGSLSHLGPSVTQNPINTTTSCNSSATITTANTTTTTAAAFTSTTTTAVGTTTTASTSSTTTTTNIATVTNNTSTATIIPPATTNKIYETDIL